MADVIKVKANETTVGRRRVWFDLRDVTNGIDIETGEAGGQPQISTNGGSWTDTGIGTLNAIGQGRYYADAEQSSVVNAGDFIKTRFKSANTAETPGDWLIVISGDPFADSVADVAAQVVATLSTASGVIIAASGENTMTVSDAVAFCNAALRNSEGGSYTPGDIKEAIRVVTAELARIARLNHTIGTVALTQGSASIDLSTLAGFRAERLTLVERADYTPIDRFSYTEVARELNLSTAEGKPLKMSFPNPTTAYVYPVPEASQSIRLHYWYPVNEFTMDDDVIQIPATYLRPALWWGVPAHMEFMNKQDALAAPKLREFKSFAEDLRSKRTMQPMISEPRFVNE